MSELTEDQIIARISEHCTTHRLPRMLIAFHGGEPLLAGPRRVRRFVEKARARMPVSTELIFSLQTNGTLLTEKWCKLFRELDIHLGISLDGPKKINDRHRVDHFGAGSYDLVRQGWKTAVHNGIQPSLLTVVDINSEPSDVFQHVLELSPSKVDFLFPDATHETPPARAIAAASETPYADWLLRLFHIWVAASVPFRIVLFERIARMVLGHFDSYDALGYGKNEVLVFETDGTIEPIDVLKACENGLTRTQYNVQTHTIDEAFDHPLIKLYAQSNVMPAAECQSCLLSKLCAGGYLPHRYSKSRLFENPSVYCGDLMKLITFIQNHVVNHLPQSAVEESALKSISYETALGHLHQNRVGHFVPMAG